MILGRCVFDKLPPDRQCQRHGVGEVSSRVELLQRRVGDCRPYQVARSWAQISHEEPRPELGHAIN